MLRQGLWNGTKYVYVRECLDKSAVISISYWMYSFLMEDRTDIRELAQKVGIDCQLSCTSHTGARCGGIC